MNHNCILHHAQYNYLWRISWLALGASMYAVYNNHYEFAPFTFAVFLSSINYWRKPDYSWRRYLDMTVVQIAFWYHIIRAYNSQYHTIYYITVWSAAGCFPIAICYYKKKMYWKSTYTHSMVHIFGNLSNVILYSGYVVPLSCCCVFGSRQIHNHGQSNQ
jgi:hypothetical protein